MKILLQKVTQAQVRINEKIVAQIGHGFLLLVGITHNDTQTQADKLIDKILKLRLFSDPGSTTFMEKNIIEASGSVLAVSQFTLYGDCRKGTRPSFTEAARPEVAKPLYDYVVTTLQQKGLPVQSGVFGEHMQVSLTNDGPITLVLEV